MDKAIRILDPSVLPRLGRARHALFDFDGTLSLLRQGWEEVMAPLMLEYLSPAGPPSADLQAEVQAYIDRSTGILTIHQMEWLAQAVRRHALDAAPLTPAEYKRRYLERLVAIVAERLARLSAGEIVSDDLLLPGARDFLARLAGRGVRLYLASGSDHPDVVSEAGILGLAAFFGGRIYGALDQSEAHDKAQVIRRILVENDLHGDELLVIGDGPVEIKEAHLAAAIGLGVASDEVARTGWNESKARRLADAGAELLIPDFTQAAPLEELLCGK